MRVNGNLSGIRDVYIEKLDSLYDMEIPVSEIASIELFDIIANMTSIMNREISVYISRRGKVIDVSVGDSSTVSLSSFDYRRGSRRLSGVRCIHTHPQGSGTLSKVDIAALINLRLDIMAGIGVHEGAVRDIYIGHLKPVSGNLSESYEEIGPYKKETINEIDVLNMIRGIEKDINTDTPELTGQEFKEKVLLIGLNTPDGEGSNDDLLDELEELAKTSGGCVVGKILQKRNKVDTSFYIGSGKAHEIGLIAQAYEIDTVIFDDELSGAQVRNLEDTIGVKVIDRTTLILDIFASRALTKEGKLQVELAQLKYRLPRLIGLGKVLSRTGGGIGTKGPGEKKLEIDRRRIRERINELEDELSEVRKNREVQREKRKASLIPMISLIGYTNSGKSTLRNKLSHLYQSDPSLKKEDVLEANMLFATLDPTTRLIRLPKGHEILMSDTVGFIRKLPHNLVDAFRATLEEVIFSDMLIHVVDSSAINAAEQIKAVNKVLNELDALDKPIILALNKIDKVQDKDCTVSLRNDFDNIVEISALLGDGIESLVTLLEDKAFSHNRIVKFRIPYDKMNIKSNLHNECIILSEEYNEDSAILTAEVEDIVYNRYKDFLLLDI